MIVADTDVLIDFLNGREPAASRVAAELERGDLRTTAVSRFELLAGARRDRQRETIETLLRGVPALPFDDGAADRAAAVQRELEARGEAIGMGDSLIAGIVLASSAFLLTRNTRHFERVSGLRLERLALP